MFKISYLTILEEFSPWFVILISAFLPWLFIYFHLVQVLLQVNIYKVPVYANHSFSTHASVCVFQAVWICAWLTAVIPDILSDKKL